MLGPIFWTDSDEIFAAAVISWACGALATPNAGFSVLVVAALLTPAPATVCRGLPLSTANDNCSHNLSFP